MNPDELHQLMRRANNSKAKLYLGKIYKSDQAFFEKLVTMFQSCETKSGLEHLRVGSSGIDRIMRLCNGKCTPGNYDDACPRHGSGVPIV